jgi:hypothetical protein
MEAKRTNTHVALPRYLVCLFKHGHIVDGLQIIDEVAE